MGAGNIVRRFTLHELLHFYRAGKCLGFGINSGMFNDDQLREGYQSIVQGFREFTSLSKGEKYSALAHSFAHLRVLEYDFFKSKPSQETRRERRECIDVLVGTGFCREQWFSRKTSERVINLSKYLGDNYATSGSQASSH